MMEDNTRKKHIHAIKQLLHKILTQKQKVIPTTKKKRRIGRRNKMVNTLGGMWEDKVRTHANFWMSGSEAPEPNFARSLERKEDRY